MRLHIDGVRFEQLIKVLEKTTLHKPSDPSVANEDERDLFKNILQANAVTSEKLIKHRFGVVRSTRRPSFSGSLAEADGESPRANHKVLEERTMDEPESGKP